VGVAQGVGLGVGIFAAVGGVVLFFVLLRKNRSISTSSVSVDAGLSGDVDCSNDDSFMNDVEDTESKVHIKNRNSQ
jgi:hypothetical protein